MAKYDEAPALMSSLPPSHSGSGLLMPTPIPARQKLQSPVTKKACLRTSLALLVSFAPMKCATWTEKEVAMATQSPLKSHVVVDTKPIEAEASAPRLPTMEASI